MAHPLQQQPKCRIAQPPRTPPPPFSPILAGVSCRSRLYQVWPLRPFPPHLPLPMPPVSSSLAARMGRSSSFVDVASGTLDLAIESRT